MTDTKTATSPEFTHHFIDLAQPRLGAEVIAASDEFFAPKERLINPQGAIFIDDKYDDHGKWMDGWESRRKRIPGHDYCIVKLCPGVIHGFDIDTSFFTGNYPPFASIEVCHSSGSPDQDSDWFELLAKTALQGDSHHYLEVDEPRTWTHLRLHIYPDGGIARLRVYGVAHCDWSNMPTHELADLAAMQHGGRALACNDMHYGHMSNLIAPGHGINMGDGWETRRRREPGNDWVMLKLGHSGFIRRIEVDTAFFKGNFPAKCSMHGALLTDIADDQVRENGEYWQPLLPAVELGADQVRIFEKEINDVGRVSHIRLDIYPDGGVSRLRLFGDWQDNDQ
jgi:allantoicase